MERHKKIIITQETAEQANSTQTNKTETYKTETSRVEPLQAPLLNPRESSIREALNQHDHDPLDVLAFTINEFFEKYGVRHVYQQANERVHPEIIKMFIRIHDDTRLISRSSMARALHLRPEDISLTDYKPDTFESLVESEIEQLPEQL